MGAQQREYVQRSRSVQSTKKITRAMELIAASRVVKARQRVAQTTPYANAITRAVSAVASYADVEHPLTMERESVRRAGVLIITSDRGLAGAYSGNVLKRSEQLRELLEEDEGKEMVPYLTGRKAEGYYRFRGRDFQQSWSGFSDAPTFEVAREIAQQLTSDFIAGSENGGVDELHIVSTRFVTMVTQEVQVVRLLPLEVVEEEPAAQEDIYPLYEFEPDGPQVLDALLPKYVTSRIWNALLQASASELAARQRAMKSATDNAEELIKTYTRLANQARQAEITQEISEIVGGASALADAK